jgi:protein-disulfide isomerase
LRLRAIIIFVCSVAAIAQEASPPSTRPDIEKIVREYILQHPEVLLDSIRMYQERERAAQQQKQKDAVKQHQAELNGDPASPFAGEAGSTATIVEFVRLSLRFLQAACPHDYQTVVGYAKLARSLQRLSDSWTGLRHCRQGCSCRTTAGRILQVLSVNDG